MWSRRKPECDGGEESTFSVEYFGEKSSLGDSFVVCISFWSMVLRNRNCFRSRSSIRHLLVPLERASALPSAASGVHLHADAASPNPCSFDMLYLMS
jgi:hypothetical protein